MKKYTKKDVKVGSIWRRKDEPKLTLRIDKFDDINVIAMCVEHYADCAGQTYYRSIECLLEVYEPIYTIEGFEV